ncbi:MAG TPA: GAF domain-containing protein [Anaerolineales bacterium]|nr:GAF domain-containing protein [Anaerolineales bacterium]
MINRFLRRRTIRGRMIGLFALLLLLLAALLGLAISSQVSLANQLNQVTQVDSRSERTLLLASARLLSARVNLIRYTTGVVSDPGAALADINQARDLLNQALPLQVQEDQADASVALQAVLLDLDEYKTLVGKLQNAISEQSDPPTQSQSQELITLLSATPQKESDLEQRLEGIVAENAQRMESTRLAAKTAAQWRLGLLIGTTVLGSILLFLSLILVARSITAPVNELRTGVEAVREGQLDTLIPITGGDELSWLARAFNQLTGQVARSYADFEQRLADRARLVDARALQLQVAAEVARDAAAIPDLDSLLQRAVDLIRERFSLYFVSIYLVDDLGKLALLRAATGEAGRTLLQRQHKIKVGEVSIVGYVTSMGAARIVNDVDADFVYRRDGLLPETHSEMACPMKAGNTVIGALDVQSSQPDVFGEDERTALQILADQLAVAIKNTRLVGELEDRLSEINSMYRRVTQESLSRVTHGGQPLGFQYDLLSVQAGQQSLPAAVMEQLHRGQKVGIQEVVQGVLKSRLLVPLMLYDQIIGVLGFDQDDPQHQWSDDEIVIIEAVSNQVIMALDNARLLDETQLRTDQLRLLQDITATAVAHTSLRELGAHVSQKLRLGLDVERCVIALLDPDGRTATRIASNSKIPGSKLSQELISPEVKIPLGEDDLVHQVIQERKAVARYAQESLPLPTSGLDLSSDSSQPTIHSVVLIPLLSRESVIGLIKLDCTDPDRRFTDEDLRLFDQLSLQISTAVEVARGVERARSKAERERMISEVTARMRSTLDVETVLRTAVEEIYQTGGFSDVSIVLTESNQ